MHLDPKERLDGPRKGAQRLVDRTHDVVVERIDLPLSDRTWKKVNLRGL